MCWGNSGRTKASRKQEVSQTNGTRRKRTLRSGFTTGTAAAAAVKGALTLILEKRAPERVAVHLLTGDPLEIALHRCERINSQSARCTVIKDAGDDPDVTNGAEIGACVTLAASAEEEKVTIEGGRGVGRVTKPGLDVAPGNPAINPGPRRMIRQAAKEVLKKHAVRCAVRVEVFVPNGETLAKKTLNARLGIVGGISILGTTGIVRPLSHAAYTATIDSALSVAKACRISRPVLTTGRRSERFAQSLWPEMAPEAFVQIGDYFRHAMAAAADKGFVHVSLAVFFGKALKMAQGVAHTHAAANTLTLDRLAEWTLAVTGDPDLVDNIAQANTARYAFERLKPAHDNVIGLVGAKVVSAAASFAGPGMAVRAVIFGYDGTVAFDSAAVTRTERS